VAHRHKLFISSKSNFVINKSVKLWQPEINIVDIKLSENRIKINAVTRRNSPFRGFYHTLITLLSFLLVHFMPSPTIAGGESIMSVLPSVREHQFVRRSGRISMKLDTNILQGGGISTVWRRGLLVLYLYSCCIRCYYVYTIL